MEAELRSSFYFDAFSSSEIRSSSFEENALADIVTLAAVHTRRESELH
jgi:hypothetical protein